MVYFIPLFVLRLKPLLRADGKPIGVYILTHFRNYFNYAKRVHDLLHRSDEIGYIRKLPKTSHLVLFPDQYFNRYMEGNSPFVKETR